MDLGAGRGQGHTDDPSLYRRGLRDLRGDARQVIGLDVDDAVLGNPAVDEARIISDSRLPLETGSVDLIVADHTFEHIEDPQSFCAEIGRVTKAGGWLCVRTPNRLGYVGVMSRLIPRTAHSAVLKVAQPGRDEKDVFPTYYRLNTRPAINRYLTRMQWEHHLFTWNAEPAYFGSSRILWQVARLALAITPPVCRTSIMLFSQKRS